GIDPDRLREEKERQLTIDLGFAWLTLPNGETVGVVDVPGHEDFIENMLAGVGGIDVAVLVIAADEGIMPQTREHFAIIDLLAIPRLVVALTKVDAVEDPEWLELVELDVQDFLAASRFADAPLIPVSAHSGAGLERLLATLEDLLDDLTAAESSGQPRLPIDRVFTLSGFGTVVTGTLLDGHLKVGDTVEIQPGGLQARIRGLQTHNEPVEVAVPGSRTAVNLTGVEKRDIDRGYVLGQPGSIIPSQLLDVELIYLGDAPRPLKHNAEVKVFVGTSEALGRVRLLDDDALLPGMASWAQLDLDESVPALRGQRFIIRFPSPPATIGGGVVLDTAPGRKWRRRRPDVMARFERLARGTPFDLVSETLIQARQPLSVSDVARRTRLPPGQIADLSGGDSLLRYEDWLVHAQTLGSFEQDVQRLLHSYHEANPLHAGMHASSLRSKLRLDPGAFDVVITLLLDAGVVQRSGKDQLHLPSFSVRFSRAQQASVDRILAAFRDQPYTPPSAKDTLAELGNDLYEALLDRGELVPVNADVVLSAAVYDEWVRYARAQLESGNPLKVSTFRDIFATTRKYALAFLEHLEAYKLTRRVDDEHVANLDDWSRLPYYSADEG
ncbi:MAG: selenocysteine-specific translation elongation factor, partial [Chloroflexi bacterium]|nr:selenocysteine-specific translation elongation factor [Chloroflexota bacterium]